MCMATDGKYISGFLYLFSLNALINVIFAMHCGGQNNALFAFAS